MFWSAISLLCAFCTDSGYAFFGSASNQWIAFVQAFAGGAIFMMLANSMIPKAYARRVGRPAIAAPSDY